MDRLASIAAFMILFSAAAGCSKSGVEEISPSGRPMSVEPPGVTAEDWPWWRGFRQDGKSADEMAGLFL